MSQEGIGTTAYRLRPRNDFVIVREEKLDEVRGLFMPQVSREGTTYVVESAGSKVTDLKPGDIVRINGERGTHWDYVPNYQNMIIVREECVVIVFEPVTPEAPTKEIDPESLCNPNRG